ncbi:MAG: methylmalonyl Co-A mutase-associated GTPase MeaB [Methanobacteriota archaeon]|nr:MAG: methylmalonyl Co-A mutase-associated GTPase MeaB [Euryarchaeota archaeon]
MKTNELISKLKQSDVRAVARLLTLIENEDKNVETVLKNIWHLTGKSYIIGITGPPGAGKSTIVDLLAKMALENNFKTGILAVDPTSPFSGGAVLGDRLRMNSAQKAGIFIRSVASRGHLGGLASTTRFMINGLEMLGNDITLVETVGAGQGDVEIVKVADTTIVVEVPGLGDEVQAQKAGILEIGDILVVNKGDRPGSDRLAKELKMMLSLGEHKKWTPPIITTTATKDLGIDELWNQIMNHREHLENEEINQTRLGKIKYDLENQLSQHLYTRKLIQIGENEIENMAERIFNRDIDPFTAIEEIIKQ